MEKIIEFLKNNNSFCLFCHESPDGDAFGSISALKFALEKLGKKCYCFCDGDIPANLVYLKAPLETDETKILSCEALILLDCNNPHRTGKYEKYFDTSHKIAIIDHHQKEDYKADCMYVYPKCPSTCDLVFEIIKELGIKIDKKIAKFLYAGISSDTGCFVHPSTTVESHLHASELLKIGCDLEVSNYNLFKYKPKGQLDFLKFYLSKTKSYLDGKVFITVFSHKDYLKFEKFISSSAFDFIQGIEGNEICLRLTEKTPKKYNISFRSNSYVNVCEMAKDYNGGGHIRASGGSSTEKKNELIKRLLDSCANALEKDR